MRAVCLLCAILISIYNLPFIRATSACEGIPLELGTKSINITLYGEILSSANGTSGSCGDSYGSVWYSMTPPPQSRIEFSTCSPYTSIPLTISIYEGTCEFPAILNCTSSHEKCEAYQGTDLVWWANGVQIFIKLSSSTNQTGQFEFKISIFEEPSSCNTAQLIPGDFYVPTEKAGALFPSSTATFCSLTASTTADWYMIQPSSEAKFQVNLCVPDARKGKGSMVVYEASSPGECDYGLTCIGKTSMVSECSSLLFNPTLGYTYYVVVFGNYNVVANYRLTITQIMSPSQTPTSLPSKTNMPSVSVSKSAYMGGTVTPNPIPACASIPISGDVNSTITGDTTYIPYGTIWYSLQITGNKNITLSTCSENTFINTAIVLYIGACYQTQPRYYSVTDSSCRSSYRTSVLTFSTEYSQLFYFTVGSSTSQGGPFELTVTITDTAKFCDIATFVDHSILVPSYFVTFGDIYSNGNIGMIDVCGYQTTNIVDYFSIKTKVGYPVIVSTCSSATTSDTVISVFSGSCDSLVCVESNDDNCDNPTFASALTFMAVYEEYYIAVTGSNGQYQLAAQQQYPPSGCYTAVPVFISPETPFNTEGFIDNQPVAFQPICYDESGRGAWFNVTFSNPGTIACNTCDSTSFRPSVQVYSGNCSNLECYDSIRYPCGHQIIKTFQIESTNQNLFILLSGSDTGYYTLHCSYQTKQTINGELHPENEY